MPQAIYLLNVVLCFVAESDTKPRSHIWCCNFIKISNCRLFYAEGAEEAWSRAGTDQLTWCWRAPWVKIVFVCDGHHLVVSFHLLVVIYIIYIINMCLYGIKYVFI